MRGAGGRRGVVAVLVGLWAVASGGLALAGWPNWWRFIAPEASPMTWLQSVVLVVAGTGALLLAVHARAAADQVAVRAWAVLGAGLLLLSLDERFSAHERLRDHVLAPLDVGPSVLPWVAPGDVVLLAVAAVGLALLPVVVRGLRADAGSLRAFALGVGLSVVAVLADSVDPARWGTAGERWEQTIEEVVELAAGLSYLAAVAFPLLAVVGGAAVLARREQEVPPP